MQASIDFASEELEQAMNDVIKESDRADDEVITENAKMLTRSVAFNTPKDTGTTRAGWWPAWNALELPGSPGTRRSQNKWSRKSGSRTYVPEGEVEDNRDDRGEKSFVFKNRTHYIRRDGKKVYYPYILNGRTNWMGKATQEAEFKFGKVHEKLLKKHSKL